MPQETDALPKGMMGDRVLVAVEGKAPGGQIGVLCYYSFGAMAVPYDEMEGFFVDSDFEGYMPRQATQKDAFMCSCSQENINIWNALEEEIITEFQKTMKETVRVEYQSMQTKDGRNEYVLARRVWLGEKGTEITPFQPNVARLSLDKEGDKVIVVPFEDYKQTELVQDIEKLINAEYQRQKKIVNRNKHVQAFYRMQEDVGMVPFGFGGGVVFVPMESIYLVNGFAKYIKQVASKYLITGHVTGMLIQPVYDEEDMKAEIARNVQATVEARYNALLNETLVYLDKLDKTEDKLKEKVEETIRLKVEAVAPQIESMKERYEKLLQTKINIDIATKEIPANASGRVQAALERLNKILK